MRADCIRVRCVAHPLMTHGNMLMGAKSVLNSASEVKTDSAVSSLPNSAYRPNVPKLQRREGACMILHSSHALGVGESLTEPGPHLCLPEE